MIGTYNETMLHRTLKELYALEGKTEQDIDGCVCDVLSADGSVIEIQTAGLSKLGPKLQKLLPERRVRVVHPIACRTVLETHGENGEPVSRRKSPKKRTFYSLFEELTGIYPFLLHPNFSLEAVLVTVTEQRVRACGTDRRRRKPYRITGRALDTIEQSRLFVSAEDYLSLLPPSVPPEFTVKDVREAGAGNAAGKMLWVLRKMKLVNIKEKKGKAFVYVRSF